MDFFANTDYKETRSGNFPEHFALFEKNKL